jgi:hypothetical protein
MYFARPRIQSTSRVPAFPPIKLPLRKLLSGLLILALLPLNLSLFVPGANAQATGALGGFMELSSVFFSEGGRTFGPGEVVTVSGAIPYIGGCLGQYGNGLPPVGRGEGRFDPFPTADFYVIPDTGQSLGFLEKLNDASGGVNRVIGTASGAFLDEVIAVTQPSGNLGAGRYDIVMDQCLDGYYDPGIDIVLGEGPQFAFEVVVPGNLLRINLHPIKESASQYQLVLDGHTISVPGGIDIEIPGFCKYFDNWVDNSTITAASTLGIWTGVARTKCVDLIKHYKGIAADPPDPNYTQFAELGALDYFPAAANTPLERATRNLAGTISEQAAIAQAMLTTVERFQGAEQAGDDLYMFLQLEELNKQIGLLIGPGGSALRFYAALETFDLALSQDPLGQSADAQALRAFLPEMRRGIGGLLPALGQQFIRKITGPGQEVLVPVGMQAWIIVYLGLNPFLPALGLPSIAEVRQFHGLPPLAFTHPTAKTGGPYTAPPGTLIHFDASKSSDPNGDALTYAWDFDGDGQFDDAATATVDFSFAQAGTQVVGLKVSDPAGNTDVAYTFVRAGDVNAQDVIAMSNREEMWRISPSGAVTTLRQSLPFISNPASLHVDVNGDIWVLRSPSTSVSSGLELARYDSTGVLLSTITKQQIENLVGFNIKFFKDFVLDGRGDIIISAWEDLGPGMREWIDFPIFNRFESNMTGLGKILRLAKDGSRASVLADVDQQYYQKLVVNGQLVLQDYAARGGGNSWASLAINPQGDIVVAYVNNLVWPGVSSGIFTMDPDTGAMTEVIPDSLHPNPATGAMGTQTSPVFGGAGIGGIFGTSPSIEVDSLGNYIFGDFRHAGLSLRLARIPIPPQITAVPFIPFVQSPGYHVEVFPLSIATTTGPFLLANNVTIDSGGDYLVAGSDWQRRVFSNPGIFRVTPDAQIFQMAVTPPPPGGFGEPSLLDVVPTIRTVTLKDIPPLPSAKLSAMSVNQQSCPGDVSISATLTNTGSVPLTNLTRVLFWDGDPAAGGVLIGAAEVNPPIAPGGSAVASFSWMNPPAGTHTIFVSAAGANTLSRAMFVCVPLPAAGSDTIVLAPATASNHVGSPHTVTATMLDIYGRPLAGAPISFDVSGANPTNGTAMSDSSGVATFQYVGANPGVDMITASFVGATSNDASVDWAASSGDTTPPVLTLPPDMVVEATGPSGAVVSFTATADDNVDGSVPVNCSPASGSAFALGITAVFCSASDAAGNSSGGSFVIRVKDTTPPALVLPANLTREATGSSGAAVTFNATANDIVDGSVPVTCAPLSGATFAVGTTAVNCSASDAAGNSASGSFDVTVQDTTAPVLTLPANITTNATSASGAVVNFTATANDVVDGARAVNCSPASGSTFPVGTTTVNCSSNDTRGNTRTGSFTVTVQTTSGGGEGGGDQTNGPKLTQITPASGKRGNYVQLYVTGSNLKPGVKLNLSGSGITVISTTRISDTFVISLALISSSAPTGARNVTATTSTGTSNALAFTVVQ